MGALSSRLSYGDEGEWEGGGVGRLKLTYKIEAGARRTLSS